VKGILCRTGKIIDQQLSAEEIRSIISQSVNFEICTHPEAIWLQPHCLGLTVDLGCGSAKVLPSALGIDKLKPGEIGSSGCMEGTTSVADISADAMDLYFIEDGTFDSVVSRHCFEHLPDPVATLREWLRILKPGHLLSMVLPNDTHHDMLRMDSDHKFRCYPNVIADAVNSLNNYGGRGIKAEVVELGTDVQCRWSFFAQIRRI
jgi:SAM-dependent methyltransferase